VDLANMQMVTQSFLVYYLTDSAAILGTTALATALPQLILLLFPAGRWPTACKEKIAATEPVRRMLLGSNHSYCSVYRLFE